MRTHNALRRLNAFHLRHGDVHQHHVRRSAIVFGDCGAAIAGFAHDFAAKSFNHLCDILAREDGIVHHQIADWHAILANQNWKCFHSYSPCDSQTRLLLLLEQFFPDCTAWPACWPAYPTEQCALHARVPQLPWACQTPYRNLHSVQWSARPHLSSIPGLRLHRRPCLSSVRRRHGCQILPLLSETKCPLTACGRWCAVHRTAPRYRSEERRVGKECRS